MMLINTLPCSRFLKSKNLIYKLIETYKKINKLKKKKKKCLNNIKDKI